MHSLKMPDAIFKVQRVKIPFLCCQCRVCLNFSRPPQFNQVDKTTFHHGTRQIVQPNLGCEEIFPRKIGNLLIVFFC